MAAKRAARKKKRRAEDPEKDNTERWLLTYSDLVTLLFAFFVILWAMSQVDPKKYDEMSRAFQTIFQGANLGYVFDQSNSKGVQGQMLQGSQQEDPSKTLITRRNTLRTQLEYRLRNIMPQNQYKITDIQEGVRISLFSDTFFDPGSPEIRSEAVPQIGKIAGSLVPLANAIRIEGHTDGTPIEGERFSKEWQLSSERALSVLNMFFAYGYPESKASVAGYGSTRPVTTNDTPEGRAFNRRVDIVVLWDKAQM